MVLIYILVKDLQKEGYFLNIMNFSSLYMYQLKKKLLYVELIQVYVYD